MTGPPGTSGASGAAPRPSGITLTSSVPSDTQLKGMPRAPFKGLSSKRRACAVATSTSQSSTRSTSSCMNAMWLPSGDQRATRIRGASGKPCTLRSRPSRSRRLRPMKVVPRLGPLLRGLMRVPPIRSSGADTSAIDGAPGRCNRNSIDRSGLKPTAGVSGASTSAASSGDGDL